MLEHLRSRCALDNCLNRLDRLIFELVRRILVGECLANEIADRFLSFTGYIGTDDRGDVRLVDVVNDAAVDIFGTWCTS